jgi:phosphoribosylformimino-5-aminoimidazole carboxamide ribonucleotide (ProFAR) isomerase
VTFEILPAIDVAGGRLVSVSHGEVREVEAFGGSPLAAAEAFVEAGAAWLHVVDVDRSNGGEADLPLLRVLSDLGAGVQSSGGIASRLAAEGALRAGADRVVLSSSVLSDRPLTAELVDRLERRVVVGLEVEGGRLRPRARDLALPLGETLAWLASVADRYLYTGVSRVASLTGPDVSGVRAAAGTLGRPVLVAGGVRGVEDVRALRDLGPETVEGCVIGRALYEGLGLRDALAAV